MPDMNLATEGDLTTFVIIKIGVFTHLKTWGERFRFCKAKRHSRRLGSGFFLPVRFRGSPPVMILVGDVVPIPPCVRFSASCLPSSRR